MKNHHITNHTKQLQTDVFCVTDHNNQVHVYTLEEYYVFLNSYKSWWKRVKFNLKSILG